MKYLILILAVVMISCKKKDLDPVNKVQQGSLNGTWVVVEYDDAGNNELITDVHMYDSYCGTIVNWPATNHNSFTLVFNNGDLTSKKSVYYPKYLSQTSNQGCFPVWIDTTINETPFNNTYILNGDSITFAGLGASYISVGLNELIISDGYEYIKAVR